jgi:hypothetical protein
MTALNKALIAACVLLALVAVYLGREQVTPTGPRNTWVMVRNPWTGTVRVCAGEVCRQVYPQAPPFDPNRPFTAEGATPSAKP